MLVGQAIPEAAEVELHTGCVEEHAVQRAPGSGGQVQLLHAEPPAEDGADRGELQEGEEAAVAEIAVGSGERKERSR